MTTLIYIKKKMEPFKVSDERGAKVKALLLNDEQPRDTIIDLGDWTGELREIKSVIREAEEARPQGIPVAEIEAREKREKEAIETFRRLPPEEKAKYRDTEIISSFSLHFKFDTGHEPPPALVEEVRMFVREYFIQNPEALNVPRDLIKKIR